MTTVTSTETTIRFLRSLTLVAAVAMSLTAMVGCSKDEPPAATTPATDAAGGTDTAEAEKPRKTSIIGAPIQKAEDVRDLSDERQKQLLEQIEGN